jgi:hypothetical protein
MPHSRDQRDSICRRIIAGADDDHLKQYFDLDPAQIRAYRRLANDAIHKASEIRRPVRHTHRAKIANPIAWVFVSATVAILASLALALVTFVLQGNSTTSNLSAVATFVAIAVAALGWCIGSSVTHRNSRIQHTVNLVATRFTQTNFTVHVDRFSRHFATGPAVTRERMEALHQSKDEEDFLAGQSVKYMLNYFEFISIGVLSGDLDQNIVRKALRGNLIFHYERCAPYIQAMRSGSSKVLENLEAVRWHFEEDAESLSAETQHDPFHYLRSVWPHYRPADRPRAR